MPGRFCKLHCGGGHRNTGDGGQLVLCEGKGGNSQGRCPQDSPLTSEKTVQPSRCSKAKGEDSKGCAQ